MEWRTIQEFENYEVSNTGLVRRKTTTSGTHAGRILASHMLHGYPTVTIYNKNRSIHRLVATTFIPNPNKYPVVNHIDGNKLNNCVENLEWCTQQYNLQHAQNIGLHKSFNKPVICVETGEIFENIKAAANWLGVTHASISAVVRGVLSHCKGYHFKYE